MKELRLYKSAGKAWQLLLGSAAFVALSGFMLTQPDAPHWAAWLGIVFFGLGIPLGLFQLLDRPPQIIINEVGIFDRTTHSEFINWELIQDAYLLEIHSQQFICLAVDEAFAPSRTQGTWRRSIASLNKGLGFQELNISLGQVKVDSGRLLGFIQAMRAAELPERTYLVKRAIANL